MKNSLLFMSSLALGIVALTSTSARASNVAADNSLLYGGSWTNGSNNGVGFGAWAFDGGPGTGGGFGQYLGATGLNPVSSFGIFSFPADSGAFAGATRPFTGGALTAGQTFSISLGYSGIATDGLIGVDLENSSGTTVFTLQADGVGDWEINDGGSNFSSGAAESANTPFVFNFTYNGGSSYSFTIGAGSGLNFTASNNLTDLSNVRLFSFQQGNGDNFGFDNLVIVPEPTTWAMLLGGAGMLTLLRRRRS